MPKLSIDTAVQMSIVSLEGPAELVEGRFGITRSSANDDPSTTRSSRNVGGRRRLAKAAGTTRRRVG